MDMDILRAILKSSDDARDTILSENYDNISPESLFCLESDTILNALCTSFHDLLYYKVSKEAYQRYSIRILIIDILRNWCGMTNNFKNLRIFASKENCTKFIEILLKKYLTDDVLNECPSTDVLIYLITAIIHLSTMNTVFVCHVDRLLARLSELEACNKTETLSCNVLHSTLHLKLSTKEKIYTLQKFKLIEKPLLDSFVHMFSDIKEQNYVNNQSNEKLVNELLELTIESAYIFQITFNFLKELLIRLRYASVVLDFIHFVLKRVSVCCKNRNRDILDLYPRKLRPCIILLRIRPEHHTIQTREYTLRIMKRVYDENKDVSLILMSHFFEWLEYFAKFIVSNKQNYKEIVKKG
ncbi:uncharacterized protein LOC105428970 [Pogonomyrmex barbatus]|uniref:Uncharacterized protein LOC105428970 n=1 Tax=Pogonomyrmex barbatus TaxID=144034 RepID=A0A6I9X642_9HYME|nr:uncharacterized protein LOC105428970 [Pogonomyrmex barbatus]